MFVAFKASKNMATSPRGWSPMTRMKKQLNYFARFAFVVAFVLMGTTVASGQVPNFGQKFSPFGKASGGAALKLETSFKSKPGTNEGTLTLNVKLGSHWHIYSLTQEDGGPIRSKIRLEESTEFTLAGDFEPDSDPVSKQESFAVLSEYHEGTFNWTAPIVFADGVDLSKVEIKGKLKGQRCEDGGSCVLVNERFVAKYGGEEAVFSATSKFHPEGSHLLLSGKVVLPENANGKLESGGSGVIEITAEPTDGYHLYERQTIAPEGAGNRPVLLAVTKSNDWELGMIENLAPSADKVKIKEGELTKYKGPVTWRVRIQPRRCSRLSDMHRRGL